MHQTFCFLLGNTHMELGELLLPAWSQVGICSITRDIGTSFRYPLTSPPVFPMSGE